LAIFLQTLGICRHPLAIEYHSLVPSLMGEGEAVKFSIGPSEATRRILAGESLCKLVYASRCAPTDHLRSALQRSLDLLGQTRLELEFAAHVPEEEQLPIEDPRIDWSCRGARRVVLATLSIGPQLATSSERLRRAERMIFTPWHTLAAHRPLGSLSRSRLYAYLASAEERSIAAFGARSVDLFRGSAVQAAPEEMGPESTVEAQ
jgi:hypothetical protein